MSTLIFAGATAKRNVLTLAGVSERQSGQAAVRLIEEGMALFSLGLLDLEDLPALALLFVNEGCEVREMAVLATSLPVEHPADRRADFERALGLAGYSLPGRLEAARTLRTIYAERGASGALKPREAARLIIDVFDIVRGDLPDERTYVGDSFDIAPVIGLYYAYDDLPRNNARAARELDNDLIEELKRLTTKTTAGRP